MHVGIARDALERALKGFEEEKKQIQQKHTLTARQELEAYQATAKTELEAAVAAASASGGGGEAPPQELSEAVGYEGPHV